MKYAGSLYVYMQHTGTCAGAAECACECVCVCEDEWPVCECGRDEGVRVPSLEAGDSELNHLEFSSSAPTPELRGLPRREGSVVATRAERGIGRREKHI